MSRFSAFLIVLVVWAVVYLPGLGSTELKGEEGRRILPAVTMLETGDWLVPYLGGKPYLRKPPLMNWLIAASFKITGVRNEWTARMPSVLAVLAMGLVITGVCRKKLGAGGALAAGLMAMSSCGLLAKARFSGAEIEGVYVPLFGIAFACWWAWWDSAPWRAWMVAFGVLGVGCLLKGPFHVAFFYVAACAVLWRAKAWKALLHPAHFAGLVLMVGIFAAWFVPYRQTEESSKALEVWRDQMTTRVTENRFDLSSYAANLPRGLLDQAPWILLLWLAVRSRKDQSGEETAEDEVPPAATKRELIAVGACFVALLLVPGILPRYVLPLGIPWVIFLAAMLAARRDLGPWHRGNQVLAAIVVLGALVAPVAATFRTEDNNGASKEHVAGWDWSMAAPAIGAATVAFSVAAVLWSRRAVGSKLPFLAGSTAAVLGAGSLLYGSAAVPWLNRRDDLRPLAAKIDKAIGPGGKLILYDPGYQAWIFYLRSPYRYAATMKEIPADAEWVLAKGKDRKKRAEKRQELEVAWAFPWKEGEGFVLLQPKR